MPVLHLTKGNYFLGWYLGYSWGVLYGGDSSGSKTLFVAGNMFDFVESKRPGEECALSLQYLYGIFAPVNGTSRTGRASSGPTPPMALVQYGFLSSSCFES